MRIGEGEDCVGRCCCACCGAGERLGLVDVGRPAARRCAALSIVEVGRAANAALLMALLIAAVMPAVMPAVTDLIEADVVGSEDPVKPSDDPGKVPDANSGLPAAEPLVCWAARACAVAE